MKFLFCSLLSLFFLFSGANSYAGDCLSSGLEKASDYKAAITCLAKEIERLQEKNEELTSYIRANINRQKNEIDTLEKYSFYIYESASRHGLPRHEGANGWWQKDLIDKSNEVAQEFKK